MGKDHPQGVGADGSHAEFLAYSENLLRQLVDFRLFEI
ncbi:MAG: hypothetical protein A4E72_01640 [Syntrophus sp. PtaU1.Bin208]|nr:MAG: hypothetical protein A4E72_01640 [Syntrophus sp. PtaU1.Bin208]